MKILLFVIAVFSFATREEVRYHWDRLFAHWFPTGSAPEQWFNPAISWQNKYFENDLLTFIFSTLLVWTTDFSHSLMFIFLNSIFMIFLLITEKGKKWWQYLIMLAVLNLAWGFVFELTMGIFGALSGI
jgi:hypothetical protein